MSSIYPLDYTIAKACICVRKLKKHFYSIKVQTKSDCTTNFVSADKKNQNATKAKKWFFCQNSNRVLFIKLNWVVCDLVNIFAF